MYGDVGPTSLSSKSSTSYSMIEPSNLKQERDKVAPSTGDRRSEDGRDSVTSNPLLHPSVSREGSESTRGFQPYRHGDDLRQLHPAAHPHFPAGLDAYAAYLHSPAAAAAAASMMAHNPYSHSAFRVDDPMMLERYRSMLPPTFMPYPGMLPPPSMSGSLLPPGMRYPPDLLNQAFSMVSPKPDHRSPSASLDRSKSEEEIRREEVERERREHEERMERERQERERVERERLERAERERAEQERERLAAAERERIEHEQRIQRERVEQERFLRERMDRERMFRPGPDLERLRQTAAMLDGHQSPSQAVRYSGLGLSRDGTSGGFGGDRMEMNFKPDPTQQQLHLKVKERDRQIMHEQFLRQQDLLLHQSDKVDKHSVPPSLGSLKNELLPAHSVASRGMEQLAFHRPYESPLVNGYEKNQFNEMDRRLMTENIMAEDRKLLRNNSEAAKSVSSNALRESGLYTSSKLNHDRQLYLDKSTEAVKARLGHADAKGSLRNNTDKPNSHSVTNSAIVVNNKLTSATQPHQSLSLINTTVNTTICNAGSTAISSKTRRLLDYRLDPSKAGLLTTSEDCQNFLSLNTSNPEEGKADQSKLDIEERRARARQRDGDLAASESEEEDQETCMDRKRYRLSLIASGPPLKQELGEEKVNFLKSFNLTTKKHKTALEFERKRKRRRLMRERSISPVQVSKSPVPHERSCSPLNYPSPIHPDSMRRTPDYKAKVNFLFGFGLRLLSPDSRRQMDMIRLACEAEIQHRNHKEKNGLKPGKDIMLDHYNQLISPPNKAPANSSNLSSPTKRKHPSNMSSVHNQQYPLTNRSVDQIPAANQVRENQQNGKLPSSFNSLASNQHPANNQLSKSTNHSSSSNMAGSSTHLRNVGGSGGNLTIPSTNDSRTVMFPRSVISDSQQKLGRDFAQEFHESVLQTTLQKELTKGQSHTPDRLSKDERYRQVDHHQNPSRSSMTPELRIPGENSIKMAFNVRSASSSSSHHSLAQGGIANIVVKQEEGVEKPILKWPGIETVIESYQRHYEEQRMEKNILKETCTRIHQENTNLNNAAERLSRRMADLIAEKQKHDEERRYLQDQLDLYKHTLKILTRR